MEDVVILPLPEFSGGSYVDDWMHSTARRLDEITYPCLNFRSTLFLKEAHGLCLLPMWVLDKLIAKLVQGGFGPQKSNDNDLDAVCILDIDHCRGVLYKSCNKVYHFFPPTKSIVSNLHQR